MNDSLIPLRRRMERENKAKIVTWNHENRDRPGGSCSCCGGGHDLEMDPPWYVYHAGIADRDGVFYSMLCQGCLEDIRWENMKRAKTAVDHKAALVKDLMPGDPDGQASMMEDMA